MKRIILVLVTVLASLYSNVQYTIETVPNPKDIDGGWVSNPDNLLNQEDVAAINSMITNLENTTSAQIAVVVVNSIGDEVPKDFANSLFKKWGIGQKDKDNGLLLLVVMEPRRWEFETGYGLEGDLPDIVLFRIGQDEMVPYFKQGDYGSGIKAGLTKVIEILTGASPAHSIEIYETTDKNTYESKTLYIFFGIVSLIISLIAISNRVSVNTTKPMNGFVFYLILLSVPIVFLLNYSSDFYFNSRQINFFTGSIYFQLLCFAFASRINSNINSNNTDPYKEYLSLKESQGIIWLYIILFPFVFIPYYIWYWIHQKRLRNAPRISSTGIEMSRLDEQADDAFLNKGQVLEEKIESVDYDVWVSPDQSEHVVNKYINSLSSYSTCQKCNYETLFLESDRTVRRATYDSSGSGIITYACKNCNHRYEETYTIPRKTRSSSSSSSSGSSSSFGGGSSGGGGAGGSW